MFDRKNFKKKMALAGAALSLAAGGVLVSAGPALAASHSCSAADEVCNVSASASGSTFASFVTNFSGSSAYNGGYLLTTSSGATLCSGSMKLMAQKSCSFGAYTGTITFSYAKSSGSGAGSVTLAVN